MQVKLTNRGPFCLQFFSAAVLQQLRKCCQIRHIRCELAVSGLLIAVGHFSEKIRRNSALCLFEDLFRCIRGKQRDPFQKKAEKY